MVLCGMVMSLGAMKRAKRLAKNDLPNE